jgi:hypothetical protein
MSRIEHCPTLSTSVGPVPVGLLVTNCVCTYVICADKTYGRRFTTVCVKFPLERVAVSNGFGALANIV